MAWYGFNMQWMLVGGGRRPLPPDERALDFLSGLDFNFVRMPTDYRTWTTGFDYGHPDESVFATLDDHLVACRLRGIHLSLNLHRAPGYCITRNDLERDNLWLDRVAQDGFVGLWEGFARRYLGTAAEALSFDLLNEPPAIGLDGFTRDRHAALIRRTVAAIRAIDPDRPIVIDGLDGGNLAMPELADLGIIHGGRGYQPYPVSHWGAEWWDGWKGGDAPRYPGVEFEGTTWGPAALRAFYEPWRAVERTGVGVHIGELGCYNRTPNDDAMRWFRDLFGLFREFGWGWAMWNLEGPFGIVGHGRPGARIEMRHGYPVDVDLLELMLSSRISQE
ncbi:MAG TPA: cellulase family glycosylhydrolase [Candidatus Limnocylindrales bacterium]|nr:cellulase family glycosylhydrolase [Candidatus Limnocylindrales bacterium]